MRIHCDGCGRAIASETAIARNFDGEPFFFCSDVCARAGRHLADEPYRDEDGTGAGPLAEGDLDEPKPATRPRPPPRPAKR
jgi:YHS domain-containing protein